MADVTLQELPAFSSCSVAPPGGEWGGLGPAALRLVCFSARMLVAVRLGTEASRLALKQTRRILSFFVVMFETFNKEISTGFSVVGVLFKCAV